MGRRKTKGVRSPSGRLKKATTVAGRQAWDYGNAVAQRRRALFDAMCIKGGKAADQAHDGIGQLWALDFLDGHGIADDTLRDAGRLYAELYWDRYSETAPKAGKLERGDRESGDPPPPTRRDFLFDRLDAALPQNSMERTVINMLCIDPWFKDEIAPFANRLVTTELARRDRADGIVVELAIGHDRFLLCALIRGLCALADGVVPARHAA